VLKDTTCLVSGKSLSSLEQPDKIVATKAEK